MNREQIFAEIVDMVDAMDPGTGIAIRLDDTPFKAYGLTSLAQIRLAAMVEDRFRIVLTDLDALAANSAVSLVTLIECKVGQAASGSR